MMVKRTIYRNEMPESLPPNCTHISEAWDIFGNVGNDSTVITLNNTFQPSSAIFMFFFEGSELHHTTAHRYCQSIKYTICDHLYKEQIVHCYPLPLNPKGASFHFVLPLPAGSKQSWAKDAIWRLVQELFNPTIPSNDYLTTWPFPQTTFSFLPIFAHLPQ